jgi:hypothetical protein
MEFQDCVHQGECDHSLFPCEEGCEMFQTKAAQSDSMAARENRVYQGLCKLMEEIPEPQVIWMPTATFLNKLTYPMRWKIEHEWEYPGFSSHGKGYTFCIGANADGTWWAGLSQAHRYLPLGTFPTADEAAERCFAERTSL